MGFSPLPHPSKRKKKTFRSIRDGSFGRRRRPPRSRLRPPRGCTPLNRQKREEREREEREGGERESIAAAAASVSSSATGGDGDDDGGGGLLLSLRGREKERERERIYRPFPSSYRGTLQRKEEMERDRGGRVVTLDR